MRALVGLSALLLGLAACQDEIVIDRNEAPSADAGNDIEQPANLAVFLDGRASFDPDGDELQFFWTLDDAPPESELSGERPFSPNQDGNSATTRFQPDVVGTYIVALRVYDGEAYSDPAYVVIEADEPTDRPMAEAGRDQVLTFGETAFLDGGQSQDPMGGILSYRWDLLQKPFNSQLESSDIMNREQRQAEFTADVAGLYRLALVVDNGQDISEADSVDLLFEGGNNQPVANAGGDRDAMDCMDVPLDCSASTDPDGDRLFYWWTIQSVPEGSAVDNRFITNQNAAQPEVYFDVAGDYQLACSVYDGRAWSRPDIIRVDVAERDFNDPPVVDAGPDRVQDLGRAECEIIRGPYSWSPSSTQCDKCEAETFVQTATVNDPDGDPFVTEWRVIDDSSLRIRGSADELNVRIEGPTISPTEVRTITEFNYFELVARDCTGEEGRDDVEVETTCEAFLP
jgi:hypothetical protein